MKLPVRIVLVFAFSLVSNFAQNDSDNAILQNLKNIDEENKIELLNQLVWKNRSKNPDKAIQCF